VRIDRDLQRQLARELCSILGDGPGVEIVYRLGLYPARVSELRQGNFARFSLKRLVNLIASLGFDIEISIRPRKPPPRPRLLPSATVVRYDRFDRVQRPT